MSSPRPSRDLERANANYARARELAGDLHSLHRATVLVSEAIALRPRTQKFYLLRGYLFRQTGALERAVVDHNAAIRLSPRSAAARCGRGLCFRKLGQYDNALTDFDESVDLSGGDSRYRFYRGLALLDLNRWEASADDFFAAAHGRSGRCVYGAICEYVLFGVVGCGV
jgi:tetratricopeptide (TPR) repeat protein